MKRLYRTVSSVIALALMFSSCGTAETTEKKGPEGSGGSKTAETIKIGYVSGLTGDGALWGQNGLNGMKIAAEEINAAGGVLDKQIEVIALDGKGDPQDSVTAYNKLVDESKVVAVLGTTFSNCNIAMAPVANQKKVPLVATAASNALVTVDEKGNLHPYSFRVGFIDPFQGEIDAKYLYNDLGISKAGVIYDIGDSYSSGIAEAFVKFFEAEGGTIVAQETARSGDNDFRAQLSSLSKSGMEALFIPWNYKDVALIAQQARELGIGCTFLGADGWDSPELIEMAGAALNDSYYCSRPGFNDPATKPFYDKYVKQYGDVPQSEALVGYDGLYWIVQCIKKAGAADPTLIRDQLENTELFEGLLGKMSVDPKTHNPTRTLAIFKGNNGKWEFVKNYGD